MKPTVRLGAMAVMRLRRYSNSCARYSASATTCSHDPTPSSSCPCAKYVLTRLLAVAKQDFCQTWTHSSPQYLLVLKCCAGRVSCPLAETPLLLRLLACQA